uniref:Uncharacterized protein n=1 Tax=Lactuca sativa TaxID=4236 RepID=A0A9R1VMU5_LACSA|nr:hypothetical protein LSAT_V11C500251310 [Lactuca sativa]
MKSLGPNTFGLMKQSRKAAKVAYQGLKELVNFGKFAEVENTLAGSSINVEVAEEHDVVVTSPSVSERERDTMVQSSLATPEQMDALIAELL